MNCVVILQVAPPDLLSGIPVVTVPPHRPFQGCVYRCWLVAKLRLSLSRAGIHMMAGHAHAFKRDQRRGHTAFPVTKEPTAQLVDPAKGERYLVGNTGGRSITTADLSQAFP